MSNRISRINTIERRFGLDAKPCAVCGHATNQVGCTAPEIEAELDAQLDEAITALLSENETMTQKLIALGEDW